MGAICARRGRRRGSRAIGCSARRRTGPGAGAPVGRVAVFTRCSGRGPVQRAARGPTARAAPARTAVVNVACLRAALSAAVEVAAWLTDGDAAEPGWPAEALGVTDAAEDWRAANVAPLADGFIALLYA